MFALKHPQSERGLWARVIGCDAMASGQGIRIRRNGLGELVGSFSVKVGSWLRHTRIRRSGVGPGFSDSTQRPRATVLGFDAAASGQLVDSSSVKVGSWVDSSSVKVGNWIRLDSTQRPWARLLGFDATASGQVGIMITIIYEK